MVSHAEQELIKESLFSLRTLTRLIIYKNGSLAVRRCNLHRIVCGMSTSMKAIHCCSLNPVLQEIC